VVEEELGSRVFLADTSAWARADDPVVSPTWASALGGDRIVTTPIVVLELLYSTRDSAELEEEESRLANLRSIPLTQSVAQAARGAMRELSNVQPRYHRIPPTYFLIAAAAQDASVGVLHYDRHFDRLTEVLDFDSVWIAPAGSL
jgi:predicted nucleic acid-binding protein